MDDKHAFGYAFIFFLYGGWEIPGTWIVVIILFIKAVFSENGLLEKTIKAEKEVKKYLDSRR